MVDYTGQWLPDNYRWQLVLHKKPPPNIALHLLIA